MCLFSLSYVPCDHAECQEYYMRNLRSFPNSQGTFLDNLVYILPQQNYFLATIVRNNEKLLNSMQALMEESLRFSNAIESIRLEEQMLRYSSNADPILEWTRTDRKFPYNLVLESKLNLPLFKERGFKVIVSIKDENDKLVLLKPHPRFRVALFTMDDPPKMLTVNIGGKKILRGTLETELNSAGCANFSNIVINEVSSHYKNDGFNLVIYGLGLTDVKPLVLPHLAVRARKPPKPTQDC